MSGTRKLELSLVSSTLVPENFKSALNFKTTRK